MFPPVGSGKAFRSSRTGFAAFVTSTVAKVFLSALRRNRYPFSPHEFDLGLNPVLWRLNGGVHSARLLG